MGTGIGTATGTGTGSGSRGRIAATGPKATTWTGTGGTWETGIETGPGMIGEGGGGRGSRSQGGMWGGTQVGTQAETQAETQVVGPVGLGGGKFNELHFEKFDLSLLLS